MQKILLGLCLLTTTCFAAETHCPTYQVCFTPYQSCQKLILKAISQAQTSILVAAYEYNSVEISQALVAAKKRGVDVQLQIDKAWYQFSRGGVLHPALLHLVKHRVPVWVDTPVNKAHNKIMIIDKQKVITGSYNFTITSQSHNAENLLLINSDAIAQEYLENWDKRLKVCKLMPQYNSTQDFQTKLKEFRQEMVNLSKKWQAKFVKHSG